MHALSITTNSEGTFDLSAEALASFRNRVRGQVLLAGDASYEDARNLWNGMIDRRPALIVRCADAQDVVAAVELAGDHDLRVSVRAGGHHVAGMAMCDDGLVIDVSQMRAVEVDARDRRVRVQAGAKLGDIDRETQAHGLAVPMGVVSDTGIAGLTLHGGFGWLTRKHGLTIDNLLAAEIVTADGKLRRVDREREPDLFWALRGGGGAFGVVTSFEFEAHPVGPEVWMIAAVYPASQRSQVLTGCRDFMTEADENINVLGVLWSAADMPAIPAEARGEPVAIVVGCYFGPVEDGAEAVRPLYELGTPLADLGGRMPFVQAQQFLDEDYPNGRFYYWKSLYLDRLDEEILDRLAYHQDVRPSPISSLDVWILGGAAQRVAGTETAYAQRGAAYMIGIEANWTERERSEVNVEWAREVHRDLVERSTYRGSYLNFPGFVEEPGLVADSFGENLARLRRVKADYDPTNLFRGSIAIGSTSSP